MNYMRAKDRWLMKRGPEKWMEILGTLNMTIWVLFAIDSFQDVSFPSVLFSILFRYMYTSNRSYGGRPVKMRLSNDECFLLVCFCILIINLEWFIFCLGIVSNGPKNLCLKWMTKCVTCVIVIIVVLFFHSCDQIKLSFLSKWKRKK